MDKKPILFNTEMVKAILEGRKTVTRRVIKPPRGIDDVFGNMNKCKQPYQVGDILYIRETWSRLVVARNQEWESERYVYKATDEYPFGEKYIVKFRWYPSIHMPKEAARIFLKVTDVRVERLQDISADEIRKEGLTSMAVHCGDMEIASKEFALLWNSTIKKQDFDRYGWDANPWVWVIEFERMKKENG